MTPAFTSWWMVSGNSLDKMTKRKLLIEPECPAPIDIVELGDFSGPLWQWKAEIQKLINRYGEHATLAMDAGYNNVSAYLTPQKDN